MHLVSGCASLVLMAAVWWVRRRLKRGSEKPGASRWAPEATTAVVVALAGHLGGFLSGVNHP